MPIAELTLQFTGNDQVKAEFDWVDSGLLPFADPLTPKDRQEIRWYVETYGAHSLADPDDQEAARIARRLPEIGQALFRAIFNESKAYRVFGRFQDVEQGQRLLTIDAEDAAILSLPWELLHDPDGTYLFRERPHISVRRRISGATGGRAPFLVKPKRQLHLLFVVSRPSDAGFIDPRTDPQAVLDAIAEHAPGRVTWEFLRPATLNALVTRLNDDRLPAIDILHFDGHGVFKPVSDQEAEEQSALYGKSIHSEIQRQRDALSRARGAAEERSPAETWADSAEPAAATTTGDRKPVGLGFLLFEQPPEVQAPIQPGTKHLVAAADLADNLFRARVGLVVLSACQTAALEYSGGDGAKDPLASVAGRLTTTGIPAILAMTHSVLVATTRQLFANFYQSLAQGRGLAGALDDARVYLANNPAKFPVRRGAAWQPLELQDWFLPALFHAGEDAALLAPLRAAAKTPPPAAPTPRHNLRPPQEAGFFGRRRELWQIERGFAVEGTRRISITGFGGQGKSELALEAGRWLTRTGLFQAACFVDYAQVQGDPVPVAVSNLSSLLGESLTDADAATAALAATPTLLILDNLEALAPEPLQALLTAAVPWSEAGGSRLLLTSRRPDLHHPAYRTAGTLRHRSIELQGLGSKAAPEDALAWFAALTRLPPAPQVPTPTREALIDLFDRVAFHPLSIAVLAQQLKSRGPDELGERLDALLHDELPKGVVAEGTPRSLIASLTLSLERLDPAEQEAVRRLGVFEGGAMEDSLLAITELGSSDQDVLESSAEQAQLEAFVAAWDARDPKAVLQMLAAQAPEGTQITDALPPELLTQMWDHPQAKEQVEAMRAQLVATAASTTSATADNPWPALRGQLEAAGLITPESIPGVGPPFLRFHPTLAPMLWAQLPPEAQTRLAEAHRRRYHQLAIYLYREDDKRPDQVRAIARRELPNLLAAVQRALAAADPGATTFVTAVNRFLNYFGLVRQAAALTEQAGKLQGEPGSRAWFLAQTGRGEQLRAQGQADAAAQRFEQILAALSEAPSYERAVTLAHLGRCEAGRGRPDRAEAHHRAGIAVIAALDQTDPVKRHRGALHTDLADVLAAQGRYADARKEYENGLEIKRELKDLRGEGVSLGQFGTLALQEGDLAEAVRRYQAALTLFQRLGEPAMEAVAQHQLGMAFQQAQQWEPAEQHYRESARLFEEQCDLAHAAGTWNQLAMVNERLGRPEAAETWYRKAIDGGRRTGDRAALAKRLSNLANLLQSQPGRLDEARRLAEEALSLKQTLDPGAAEIWTTYTILAQIAEKQARPDDAAAYRRQAREAKRAFAGTAHEMRQFAPLIAAVVGAVQGHPEAQTATDQLLARLNANGGEDAKAAAALQRILQGERDPAPLCANLGLQSSMFIETLLQALDDPTLLGSLLPNDPT